MERTLSAQKKLIFLCWLLYASAYAGRYSYASNVNLIMEQYGVTRADAGLVTSAFFFAYGIGQIIHGFLCRYYHRRYVLPVVMFLSAAVNFTFFLGLPFFLMKYLWALNGIVQATLWTSLMRVLGTSIEDGLRPRAVLVMGTTTASGTFVSYFASFLFVRFLNYRFSFLFAAVLMVAAGLTWLLSYRELGDPAEFKARPVKKAEAADAPRKKLSRATALLLPVICAFAVLSNLIKDGLQQWVPNVLKEAFALPDDFSILLTLALPMLAMLGATIAVWLQKRVPNFLAMETIFFFCTALVVGGILLFLQRAFVPALICFGLTALLQAAINNVNTGMVPIFLNHEADSGMLAGIINACCYLGSTISSYGLGALADAQGWNWVFRFLFFLTLIPVVTGTAILSVRHLRRKRM
ncbi:MAG: MFS transporter [Clostridia bacterium]|nr:MFS transporter [Clostridia bacterium]